MSLMTPRRMVFTISGFALFALATMALSPLTGAERISSSRAIAHWIKGESGRQPAEIDTEVDIFFYLRLPRIVLAFLTGAALGVVGAVFQAMLRNPLATPYTLGVAGGGSFGAVVAMFLPAFAPVVAFKWGPFNYVQCFAFAGSILAVAVIYLMARTGGRISTMELLLAGVTMGMIFSALILAVRYFSSPNMLVGMDRWLMGGLDVGGWGVVVSVLPFLLPGVAVLMAMAAGYDQISFGEELATGRGVNVHRLQKMTFLFGSLATASVVAVAGPIGFVGLIVPHTVRRLVGPAHCLLLPCTFFAAGGFLVVCDTLARTVIAPTDLPVGIITALLGGPFFIYLLIQGRRTGKMWGNR
jgi:iron complex transport system permease protein